MLFRWFDKEFDKIPLLHIRQILGVTGVVTSLLDIPVGEIWPLERLKALKEEVESYGLKLEVIESVNVHEDIKLGLETRDRYIENYIKTMKNLSQIGVKVICYNFMPAFDWLRPDHGRMIWGETGRPGYGLYDRALGAVCLQGLWEAIGKMSNIQM